jgi:3-hydroxyisobutyrate dehydrogenase
MKKKIKVGCLGAGVLGAAIIERLIASDFEVQMWNRDRLKLKPLELLGGKILPNPKSVAECADVVIICVKELLYGDDGLFAANQIIPDVIIDMSTCDVNETKRIADDVRTKHGILWLDAPISGGAPAAREGRMTIMVGGDQAAFESVEPIWSSLGGQVTRMGDSGSGQATKMINQLLVSSGLVILAEACALAETLGIDVVNIPSALKGGRADSYQLQEMFPKMARSEHTITATANIMLKDLSMITNLFQERGLDLSMVRETKRAFSALKDRGWGDRDTSELINLYR